MHGDADQSTELAVLSVAFSVRTGVEGFFTTGSTTGARVCGLGAEVLGAAVTGIGAGVGAGVGGVGAGVGAGVGGGVGAGVGAWVTGTGAAVTGIGAAVAGAGATVAGLYHWLLAG